MYTPGVSDKTINIFYLLAMIVAIVLTDILFFKNHAMARLAVNVGIVLVFGAFYFRFLK
jgi:hypothetical protein